MPKSIVNRQKTIDVAYALHRAVQDVNQALSSLLAMSDGLTPPKTAHIEDWEKFNETAEEMWNNAQQAIEHDPQLLPADKEKRLREWRIWYAALSCHIRNIKRALTGYPQAKWTFNEHLSTFTPTEDVDAIAEAQAMEDVPEDAAEHARLIRGVADAAELLRAWEKSKNIKKIDLLELCNLSEEALAEAWVSHTIFYPTDYDSPQILSSRAFREKMIL